MKNIKLIRFLLMMLLLISNTKLTNGVTKKENDHITVKLHHYVSNKLLALDTLVYVNNLDQHYSVSKFRYYLSNIVLTTNDNNEISAPGYYLIDDEDEKSKTIELTNIPVNSYHMISFLIGVDSIHNCSGTQTGALDPVKGMFWAWNTGYIFLKLEGNSPQSTAPGNTFEYHIGGYMEPNNCIRKATLILNNLNSINAEAPINSIDIKVDVAEILKNPIEIDFSAMPIVTDFHNATKLADNYKDMFSILEVK